MITYEWIVEIVDYYEGCGDDPDIIDSVPFDTLTKARDFGALGNNAYRIALRRDEGNDAEGLTWRGYAYPIDNMLPECFETCDGAQDGPRIPQRFHREIARTPI